MPSPSPDLSRRAGELVEQDLLAIEMLVDAGKHQAAAVALRHLLQRTTPEVSTQILQRAAAWELAREREWVQPERPDPVRFVPGGRVQRRQGEPRRLTSAQLAQDQARRAGAAVASAYLAEQEAASAPERPDRGEPVWGDLDYDRAALPDMHGRGCLCCRVERTRTDLAQPDGLCGDCRDSGLTREGVIEGYCELIAERNPGEQATALLRQAWTRATRTDDRAVIADWVSRHQSRLHGAAGGADAARTQPGATAVARAAAAVTPARPGLSNRASSQSVAARRGGGPAGPGQSRPLAPPLRRR